MDFQFKKLEKETQRWVWVSIDGAVFLQPYDSSKTVDGKVSKLQIKMYTALILICLNVLDINCFYPKPKF